jgi:hypothetical protein
MSAMGRKPTLAPDDNSLSYRPNPVLAPLRDTVISAGSPFASTLLPSLSARAVMANGPATGP